MRTTVWVVGILLSLPGQGLDNCVCWKSLIHFGGAGAQHCDAMPSHLHVAASSSDGDHSPCQCDHRSPQQTAITPRENRSADDIDSAVRLAACTRQHRCVYMPHDRFSVPDQSPRALPALALCATLSRFLL
ncbi:hypothetical protein LOC69_23885 [Blastopirellula sp. JC733]|nr:hypothetical protein [Blastopirellula sediminis]